VPFPVAPARLPASQPAEYGYVSRDVLEDFGTVEELSPPTQEPWTWQVLPCNVLYRSYLAGGREPRMAMQFVHERDQGWLWDATLGARVGILRYGTQDPFWPEGFEIDVAGAAFPRLDPEEDRDVVATDFRIGVPLTFRVGSFETKFGYYHLSSHLGDEFLLKNPTVDRINYVRDALVLGVAVFPHPDVRLYSEVGYAFNTDGGAEPWEAQFGVDYSPTRPTTRFFGDPFVAVNGHIREEVDWGGNFTVQTGLQWRGVTGRLFRLGLQYFNGKSDQTEFYTQHEEQIGLGIWYDF